MSSLDKALLIHYDKGGYRFEIYVDKSLVYDYKEGKIPGISKILITDEIFKDARKGIRYDEKVLRSVFGTTDPYRIADEIIKHGEIPLTTDMRKKLIEEKKKKIISIILREAIDPRTKAPIPEVRLLNALEKVKIHIDPFKQPEIQVKDVVNALRPVLPIHFEKVKIAVKVPAEQATRVYGILKEYGIKKEEWTNTGSLIAVVEMPAGLQLEFYDRINKMTHGSVETKIIE
ncbi:ribosome assembly factor SBDS [Candidatus Micrarchaeota archaeon]|nr:ribosome assembly factor SBDS [Candidatus Micrarchaeota archaeon]